MGQTCFSSPTVKKKKKHKTNKKKPPKKTPTKPHTSYLTKSEISVPQLRTEEPRFSDILIARKQPTALEVPYFFLFCF